MYKIQQTVYGFRLTFDGFIQAAEMQQWCDESKKILPSAPKEFGVFVDMRTLKPLPPDAQPFMQEGQKLYKGAGMIRSVVVVADAITRVQFRRIAQETKIYEWERYIDASAHINWEQMGIDWLTNGKDPDK